MESMQVGFESGNGDIFLNFLHQFYEHFLSLLSDVVGNYWVDSPLSMLPIYQELIAAGLRICVFR